MPRLDFIDISHYQGNCDFAKIKAQGIIGVVAKATEGTSYVDPNYTANRDGALAAELKFAAYHYLKSGNTAAQMQWFIKQAALPDGSRLVIDYEDSNLSLEDLRTAINWLSANADMEVTTYCGGFLKGQIGSGPDPVLASTSLWIAQYNTSGPSWPTNIWPQWTAWQYTDNATVDGINGGVDGDQFNGSAGNCAMWFGPKTQPQPSPPPPPATTAIVMTVASGTTVTINGQDFIAP